MKWVKSHADTGANCVIDELITATWEINKDLIRNTPTKQTVMSHRETKSLLKASMHQDETAARCTLAANHRSESSRNIRKLELSHKKLKKWSQAGKKQSGTGSNDNIYHRHSIQAERRQTTLPSLPGAQPIPRTHIRLLRTPKPGKTKCMELYEGDTR